MIIKKGGKVNAISQFAWEDYKRSLIMTDRDSSYPLLQLFLRATFFYRSRARRYRSEMAHRLYPQFRILKSRGRRETSNLANYSRRSVHGAQINRVCLVIESRALMHSVTQLGPPVDTRADIRRSADTCSSDMCRVAATRQRRLRHVR